MDLNAYAIPTTTVAYDYPDDGLGGLGGLVDDGLGTGYEAPESHQPAPDSYMDDFFSMDVTAAAPTEQADEQPADNADADGQKDLEAALDDMWDGSSKPAGDASKSQQADEDSELTIDEAVSTDGETARSRDESQGLEDPAHAEEQKLNAWKQECYDAMTEAQRNRLEAYNRSNLQKKTMKKVLQELTGSGAANDRLLHALGSVTKMFVGELVATARQIASCQGHTGALLPSHIRAAYQVLSDDGKVPHRGPSKPLRLH